MGEPWGREEDEDVFAGQLRHLVEVAMVVEEDLIDYGCKVAVVSRGLGLAGVKDGEELVEKGLMVVDPAAQEGGEVLCSAALNW